MSERRERCGNCRFFEPNWLQCRRHAPGKYVVQQSKEIDNGCFTIVGAEVSFPLTSAGEWCGEYQRNPDAPFTPGEQVPL